MTIDRARLIKYVCRRHDVDPYQMLAGVLFGWLAYGRGVPQSAMSGIRGVAHEVGGSLFSEELGDQLVRPYDSTIRALAQGAPASAVGVELDCQVKLLRLPDGKCNASVLVPFLRHSWMVELWAPPAVVLVEVLTNVWRGLQRLHVGIDPAGPAGDYSAVILWPPLPPINYRALDPGIRATVRLLREHGFDTTDSGDGFSKPDVGCTFDRPHVAATVSRETFFEEAERLRALLDEHRPDGLGPWQVEATYWPATGTCVLLAHCEPKESA